MTERGSAGEELLLEISVTAKVRLVVADSSCGRPSMIPPVNGVHGLEVTPLVRPAAKMKTDPQALDSVRREQWRSLAGPGHVAQRRTEGRIIAPSFRGLAVVDHIRVLDTESGGRFGSTCAPYARDRRNLHFLQPLQLRARPSPRVFRNALALSGGSLCRQGGGHRCAISSQTDQRPFLSHIQSRRER